VSHPVGSNVTSVAEDEVMRILVLIRNYLPARDQVVKGDWDVPAVAVESWDLMDKTVGTVGGGRIGYHMMKRLRLSLAPMLMSDCHQLLYNQHAVNKFCMCVEHRCCTQMQDQSGGATMHPSCCLHRHCYVILQQILLWNMLMDRDVVCLGPVGSNTGYLLFCTQQQ